jgi:hypothetical protein
VEAKLTGTPNISLVGIIVYGAVMAGPSFSQIFETFRNMSTARIPQMFTFFRKFPKS